MTVSPTTTLLNAVNRCLSVIAERPVTTLSGTLTADAQTAYDIVQEIDVEVQSRAWQFNTERKLLTPSGNKIDVPANCVRLFVNRAEYPSLDITIRDDSGTMRLYDKVSNSFTITSSVYATLVTLQEFEKTPEAYRRYVTIRAARTFCDRAVSDNARHVYTERDEAEALKQLQRYENNTGPRSLFDNYDAARPILRRAPGIFPASPIEFG